MAVDLYAGKTAMLGRLAPLVGRLAEAGISADALTLAALPVAALAAACLALSPSAPALLLAIPILAGLRILLNLLDGAVARLTGRSHPRGELLNELGDRLADVGFLAPVAILPGASPTIVLLGVVVGVLASYVGITARAAGGERIYRGILSKPGRMTLLSVAAIAAFVAGDVAWTWFGPLLLLGTSLTLVERIAIALRRLP
jgi:CDP-diacylglycerol--glycerol-3-phosphate 3-phosphatidyltransferase